MRNQRFFCRKCSGYFATRFKPQNKKETTLDLAQELHLREYEHKKNTTNPKLFTERFFSFKVLNHIIDQKKEMFFCIFIKALNIFNAFKDILVKGRHLGMNEYEYD